MWANVSRQFLSKATANSFSSIKHEIHPLLQAIPFTCCTCCVSRCSFDAIHSSNRSLSLRVSSSSRQHLESGMGSSGALGYDHVTTPVSPPQQSQAGHHQSSFCRTKHTKFLFFSFVRGLCMSWLLAWIDFIREILLSQVSAATVPVETKSPGRYLRCFKDGIVF